MTRTYDRRTVVKSTGAVIVGVGLAGCSSNGSDDGNGESPSGNTVLAGPDQELVFEPKEITVAVNDTVTWEFESDGHNVSAYPDHHDVVSIPEDAEPFGTEGVADDKFATVSSGTTFEHTFEVAGEYEYACIPHAGSDMVGTVVVEE